MNLHNQITSKPAEAEEIYLMKLDTTFLEKCTLTLLLNTSIHL